MAPRKQKHQNQNQHQKLQAVQQQLQLQQYAAMSNYEVDPSLQAHLAVPPPRSDTELNIAVLQRYNPEVNGLEHIAPYGVVYEWSTEQNTWDKCGIEGSVFICRLWGNEESDVRYAIVVLNRRQLHNLNYELRSEAAVEFTDEYIILMDHVEGQQKIWGLWIFAEPPPSSTATQPQEVTAKVKECVRRAEEGRNLKAIDILQRNGGQSREIMDQSVSSTGRQLTVQELFALGGSVDNGSTHDNQPAGQNDLYREVSPAEHTIPTHIMHAPESYTPSLSGTPSMFSQSADTAFFLSSQRGTPSVPAQSSPNPPSVSQSRTEAAGLANTAQKDHLLNLFRQAGSQANSH